MRIVFAGNPDIALPSLYAAANSSRHVLAGILTNPGKETPAALAARKIIASCKGEEKPVLLQFDRLDGQAREAVAAIKPDMLVCFAYGKIFGPKFLALFPKGGINIHPSLLPKYRGPAPIPAVILGRESETGITIQRLAEGMDEGDILAQERFALSGRETTASLSARSAERGAALFASFLDKAGEALPEGRPQAEGATYCGLIKKADGVIDWRAGAAEIDARIRAYTPWPLSRTFHGNRELVILEAQPLTCSPGKKAGEVLGIDKEAGILVQTGEGILGVTRLQYSAKKALDWRAFMNGARNFIGSVLGDENGKEISY
jgi:methionyl-tRNA formyltransferase